MNLVTCLLSTTSALVLYKYTVNQWDSKQVHSLNSIVSDFFFTFSLHIFPLYTRSLNTTNAATSMQHACKHSNDSCNAPIVGGSKKEHPSILKKQNYLHNEC